MISIDDIMDAINSFTKANLVLHRKMVVHPKFKVYKIYSYNLYKVTKDENELLLNWDITKNVPVEELKNAWVEADKEFLSILFNWLSSDKYREINNDEV